MLNATSLQLITAYCSQNSGFAQSLAGVGLSEPEQAGVGSRKQFPKPLLLRLDLPFDNLIYGTRKQDILNSLISQVVGCRERRSPEARRFAEA